MLATEQPSYIFAGAWTLYEDALEMLAAGRMRNAAEKAWGATKRATDALITARSGEKPEYTSQTSRGIRALSREGSDLQSLRDRYFVNIGALHGNCFYEGDCEPAEVTAELVRAVAEYIRDAETAAGTATSR